MRFFVLLAATTSAFKVTHFPTRDGFNTMPPSGCHDNKTTCNPTHYGSPVDGPNGMPPINCQGDEDGLILDSFVFNVSSGKTVSVMNMWCSPHCNATMACPTDKPGGSAVVAEPSCFLTGTDRKTGEKITNCILNCTKDSDCGGGAICANETGWSFCGWPWN